MVWIRQTQRVRGGETCPCYSAPDEFVLRRVGVRSLPKLALSTLTRSNLFPPENLGVFLLLPRQGKGGWHGARFCGPILAGGDFRVGSRVLKPRDFSRLGRRGCASQPRSNSVCTSDQHDEFDHGPFLTLSTARTVSPAARNAARNVSAEQECFPALVQLEPKLVNQQLQNRNVKGWIEVPVQSAKCDRYP
jgi:hypothetical protein